MRRFLTLFAALFVVSISTPAEAANRLYEKHRQGLVSFSAAGLSAPVDVATDTIKIAAVTASYTPNTTTHQFYSSVSTAVIGTPVTLTYGSSTGGVYKSSNNPAFSIPATSTVTYFVIYKDTGTAATSPLIAIIDTASGLPFTAGSSATSLNLTMDATNGWYKP